MSNVLVVDDDPSLRAEEYYREERGPGERFIYYSVFTDYLRKRTSQSGLRDGSHL